MVLNGAMILSASHNEVFSVVQWTKKTLSAVQSFQVLLSPAATHSDDALY